MGSRCRVRIHDAHVRPRYGVLQRRQDPALGPSGDHRRRGAGPRARAPGHRHGQVRGFDFHRFGRHEGRHAEGEAGGGAGVGGDSLEQEPAEHLPHRQKGRRHPLQQHGEVQPGGREDGLQHFKRINYYVFSFLACFFALLVGGVVAAPSLLGRLLLDLEDVLVVQNVLQ